MTEPGSEAARLDSGAAELGVPLTPAAAERLLAFLDLLYAWNRSVGLTSVDRSEAVRLHLLDSLACVPLVPRGARVADLGSGCGMPGLAVAVARPDVEATLVESRRKRCSFLSEVTRTLALGNCQVRETRAQELAKQALPGFDLVTARGLGPPSRVVELARRLLAPDGVVLLLCARRSPASVRGLGQLLESRSFVLPGGQEKRTLLLLKPVGAAPGRFT